MADTNDCEVYETLIEQRRAVVLVPAEVERLDVHLKSCSGCRAFADVVVATEASLRGEVEMRAEAIDWSKFRERALDTAERYARRRLAMKGGVLVFMVALVATFPVGGAGTNEALVALGVGAACLAAIALKWRRDAEDVNEAPQEAFFYVYERQLRRRLRSMWASSAIAPLALGWVLYTTIRTEGTTTRNFVVPVSALLIVFGSIGHTLLVKRPHIARELESLGTRQ